MAQTDTETNETVEPTEQDYVYFQRLLEHFVHLLRRGAHLEERVDPENLSGPRDRNKGLMKDCAPYLSFSNGQKININVAVFRITSVSCFIGRGPCNIIAKWNKSKGDIIGLQFHFNNQDPLKRRFSEDTHFHSLTSLGLVSKSVFDKSPDQEPNDNLKQFYKDYDKFFQSYVAAQNAQQQGDAVLQPINQDRIDKYVGELKKSKNIIFHGAPGTGKTYLAKQIAAQMIGITGKTSDEINEKLADSDQFEFVQFHPSYDYTDFVEGLRPKTDADGTLGFELKAGTFSEFVAKAQHNMDNEVTADDAGPTKTTQQQVDGFLTAIGNPENVFHKKDTSRGGEYPTFSIVGISGNVVSIKLIGDDDDSPLPHLDRQELIRLLQSQANFDEVKEIAQSRGGSRQRKDTYYWGILNEAQRNNTVSATIDFLRPSQSQNNNQDNKSKPYIFVIDEINRGEISKIFGELFFSLDPDYRGPRGGVQTQYANMHRDPNDRFYIPENVYIIGTMNDIDRSVESFDFAMRRRFRFINISAQDTMFMLDGRIDTNKLDDAKRCLTALNETIAATDGLGESYEIGPSYFMKLPDLNYDYSTLWADYIGPLLEEYLRGFEDEQAILDKLHSICDPQWKPIGSQAAEQTAADDGSPATNVDLDPATDNSAQADDADGQRD